MKSPLLDSINIYLIGMSYTGKTIVGKLLSESLNFPLIDTDQVISEAYGKEISQIFIDDGESVFREDESKLLKEISTSSGNIISTGGGIIINPENLSIMKESGIIIYLDAASETILNRINTSPKLGTKRPLMDTNHPLTAINNLRKNRLSAYMDADWIVKTDYLTPDEVKTHIINGIKALLPKSIFPRSSADFNQSTENTIMVETATGDYPIYTGTGLIHKLPEYLNIFPDTTKFHVIIDSNVFQHHKQILNQILNAPDSNFRIYELEADEENKNILETGRLFSWLADGKAERSDVVIAIGGGVTGDIAGFVSSTYVRGLKFIQIPTTLLSMVDASIGGKVAIDLDQGKNLVGSFHQPEMVIIDTFFLTTLPQNHRVSGAAEIVKTALILDKSLVHKLESVGGDINKWSNEDLLEIIRSTASIKASIVSIDEKEKIGFRARLNYGHTLGHAIEAAGNYKELSHGESISLGMVFAASLAHSIGLLSDDDLANHNKLISIFSLPSQVPNSISADDVTRYLTLDKKVQDGNVQWVLLDRIGHGTLHRNIDVNVYKQLIKEFITNN